MDLKPKEILLVQLYSNGDCLYATAVARQIKNDFPECRLTWAVAAFCKNIVNLNPFVDAVLVVDEVKKNDIPAFRKWRKKILQQKNKGIWDEVIITSNMDKNIAFYDGTIRGMILRAYPGKITVPLEPVLVLSEQEKENVKRFALAHQLSTFKHVILWEYAPQSGQSDLNLEMVMGAAKKIVEHPFTCVILSSANVFTSTHNIIDASALSVRENAALTHYCNVMIGCSSGITWLNMSSAGKKLPMIQLLNDQAIFNNIPSVDFERFGLGHKGLLEIFKFDQERVVAVVHSVLKEGFEMAKRTFEQKPALHFRTTERIVYNLLCYFQFGAIYRHIMVMGCTYGWRRSWWLRVLKGILLAPFTLLSHLINKKFLRN